MKTAYGAVEAVTALVADLRPAEVLMEVECNAPWPGWSLLARERVTARPGKTRYGIVAENHASLNVTEVPVNRCGDNHSSYIQEKNRKNLHKLR